MMIKKNILRFSCLFILFTSYAFATVVKIGAYEFPPFVTWVSGKPNGVLVKLSKHLNETQKKYSFELIETSSNRRYDDMKNKYYDIIFFENIQWGWLKYPVQASKVFLVGGEVFITKILDNKNQTYFNDLKNKTIRGILGYHYGFANFLTDPLTLKKWNIELTNSHEGNIVAVLEGRSDLAIVTKEYLDIYLKKNSEAKKNLLVSNKMDQMYHHTVLIREGSPISVSEINGLLDNIKKDQSLKNILDYK
ncbi:MAG: transporter substrate-binding domain-containing protein [Bacteriovorax sp.]|nr:transporter substrate-binding domain-containing protein [Bacteriovorax sp.]